MNTKFGVRFAVGTALAALAVVPALTGTATASGLTNIRTGDGCSTNISSNHAQYVVSARIGNPGSGCAINLQLICSFTDRTGTNQGTFANPQAVSGFLENADARFSERGNLKNCTIYFKVKNVATGKVAGHSMGIDF